MDTARQAREWLACADACWAAARHLPDQEGRFQLPRLRLAGLAVEYRLRAFICLSRRGTPDSHDLGHNCAWVKCLLVRWYAACAALERARELHEQAAPAHLVGPRLLDAHDDSLGRQIHLRRQMLAAATRAGQDRVRGERNAPNIPRHDLEFFCHCSEPWRTVPTPATGAHGRCGTSSTSWPR